MHKIWVWRCEAWVFLPTCWFFCNSSKTVKVVNLVFCSTDWLFTRDIHAKFEIPNSPQSPDITAQKMKFSIKDFFSKYDIICRKLRIWSHLLKKSLTLFRMGFFGAARRWGGAKKATPLENLSRISYNDETSHSYTLPKEVPKTIWITRQTLCSADISIFLPEISKFCHIKKYKYRFHLDI